MTTESEPVTTARHPAFAVYQQRRNRTRVVSRSRAAELAQEQRESKILTLLVGGAKLTSELPRSAELLASLEVKGYAFSRCIQRLGERTVWLWQITNKGRQWLRCACKR